MGRGNTPHDDGIALPEAPFACAPFFPLPDPGNLARLSRRCLRFRAARRPPYEMLDAMREPIRPADLVARFVARALLLTITATTGAGCGSEDGPGGGAPTPVDDVGGGGGDASGPPEFSPCTDNLDCAGGEVCRDEVCRVACE